MINFTTNSAEETMRLGTRIGQKLPRSCVIALSGDLGCGKTTFVKGLARALGVNPSKVNSPSYVLIKEYSGEKGDMFHFDLYRLDKSESIFMLGLDDYFVQNGMLAIEWAEKAKDLLPDDYICITIKALSEKKRKFSFRARGNKYKNALERINRKLMKKKTGNKK